MEPRHATISLTYIAMREAILRFLTNCSKSHVFGDLYGRLSIILVQANARAILARSLQVTADIDAIDYYYDHFVCICCYTYMYINN